MWIKERRLAKLLINGTVAGRHKIDDKISNLEVMNNSHGFYQIGKKPGSGKTLHGLVRQLKVFKEELSNRKIKTEMTTFNIIGMFECSLNAYNILYPEFSLFFSQTFVSAKYYVIIGNKRSSN